MRTKTLILRVIYIVTLLSALGLSGYFYYQYHIAGNNGESETSQLVANIGKHMELPDEIPTVATVSDKTKLEDQPFFQRSQNGDKVLIYQKFGRAVLYRPSTDKIIDAASLNLDNSQPAFSPSLTPQSTSVALYNGTDTSGLTNKFEASLKTAFTEVNIIEKKQAQKKDYEKTLIVDISKKYPNMVKQLASELSAEISLMPEGEAQPNSDILIILGKDKL